jgi:hypothetical protein
MQATIGLLDYRWQMSFTIPGWVFGIGFFAVLTAVLVFIQLIHSSSKRIAEAGSDLKFEGELQQVISRSRTSQAVPTWTAPKLPASVIAAIWTHRFIGHPTQPLTETQRYESSLRRMTWTYSREAPYIVAMALLSLQDEGLIAMSLDPRGRFLDSFERVRVERTEQPPPSVEMPAVEGGLLLACVDIAHKRFGKSDQPSVHAVVREWMGAQGNPYKWVLDSATFQGRQLGLYEPTTKKREKHPVFSMGHLAACDDQVIECVNRWERFGVTDTDVQQRLITECSSALAGIASSASGG